MSNTMISMKRLNVVKVVDSETKAKTLETKGFKRVVESEKPDDKKGKKDEK